MLVVEDDDATRSALGDLLELLSYRVLLASNGQEAWAIVEEGLHAIDVVVTDLVMPSMGGVELYRMLKEARPRLPVIVVTGYPLGEETRRFLQDHEVSWMQKPFASATLATMLQEALGNPSASMSVA